MSATKYGLGSNPGGWRSDVAELAVYQRNHIDTVLWCAYEPNQQGVIADLRNIGVQHFVIRACIGGKWDTASNFAAITLPMLKQFASALGSSNDMLIQVGNEPNLVEEGWTHMWQTGQDYAAWWLAVAAVYRVALPNCKLGFAPMSPGGDVPGVRMDERGFMAGCSSAIAAADFMVVHNYWNKADASDLAGPITMWRSQANGKALFIGESGPNLGGPNANAQALQHAHSLYSAANIPCTFFLADSSGRTEFNNCAWKQQNITVNPNEPSEPAPQLPPPPAQTGNTDLIGLHVETTGGVGNTIPDMASRLHATGHPLGGFVVIDDVNLANNLIQNTRYGIFRSYPAGQTFSMSKIGSLDAAFNHANEVWANHQSAIANLDKRIFIQTRNESGINEFDWAYEVQIMKLAEAQGRRAAIYGDSVGTPDPAQWFWRLAANRYAMAHGHCVVRHDYSPFINGQPSNLPVSGTAGFQYYGGRTIWLYNGSPADCRPLFINGETGNSSAYPQPGSLADIQAYNLITRQYAWYGAFCWWGMGRSQYNANGLLPGIEAICMTL